MIAHSKPWIVEADLTDLRETAQSGWLIDGPAHHRLASVLASICAAKDAALFSSGRNALRAALLSLDLPPGAGVIVQAYVCEAVEWAIRAAGLAPIPCDIGPAWTCTPQTVARAADGTGAAALLLAPPFGLFQSAAPYRALGLPIIHDLCQASPSVLAGRWDQAGDVAVLSFHPTKYVGAAGGGAVVGALSDRVLALAHEWGAAAPFGDLQAALVLSQLQRLDETRERRGGLLKRYRAELPQSWTARFAAAQDVQDGDLFRCIVTLPGVDFATARLRAEVAGVALRLGVDSLLSASAGAAFPRAVETLARTISLPFYPALSDEEADVVIACTQRLGSDVE